VRLRDPIMVRSTLSGLSNYYYYPFGFFWIIFYSFPHYKALPFYLITSPVPTCLVHNCETSRRLFYFHLLSLLSRDQIPFDSHHQSLPVNRFTVLDIEEVNTDISEPIDVLSLSSSAPDRTTQPWKPK